MSACPICGAPLGVIPPASMFSWLFLAGGCGHLYYVHSETGAVARDLDAIEAMPRQDGPPPLTERRVLDLIADGAEIDDLLTAIDDACAAAGAPGLPLRDNRCELRHVVALWLRAVIRARR